MGRGGLTLLLLAVSLCAVLCESSPQGENTQVEPITISPSPIANKPVQEWSVPDVEYWMNHTVGYAEFGKYVRKYLVDGPTLLEMEPADFEEHFPVDNAIQVVKLTAHMKLLKGFCLCGAAERAIMDFWSYFAKENFRVWVVGGTAVFFPRLAMLYTFFFDDELYKLLVGVPVPQASALSTAALDVVLATTRTVPVSHTLLYLFCLAAAPDLFMAYEAACLAFTNYFVMPFFFVHYILQAFNSYFFLFLLWKGNAFPPNTSVLEAIWMMHSYTLFVPPAALLLYPIIPYFVQSLLVYVLMGHTVVVVVAYTSLFFESPKTPGERA
ncbi:hypothetical protein C3747_41g77 [Trypanosoma cruzi]|uniref:SAM domain-containing protein n=2 Tax=Trypanosoma cruzi TaxID=5693 RepID=Q4CUY1_TRYCC|nr:hypothetical protein, conserved [Trypanosoma cruzi]EAN84082.1 hypothetical protein, conserved [Trypanosoma cruzi]PWV13792.1 hypothetical protein C3747_41g77 [Trypanosoma cruzi]|eukprot:XP_805933.1 hypothetical protein [Trypanosoma cruzi strain CL Brener]